MGSLFELATPVIFSFAFLLFLCQLLGGRHIFVQYVSGNSFYNARYDLLKAHLKASSADEVVVFSVMVPWVSDLRRKYTGKVLNAILGTSADPCSPQCSRRRAFHGPIYGGNWRSVFRHDSDGELHRFCSMASCTYTTWVAPYQAMGSPGRDQSRLSLHCSVRQPGVPLRR